jgi:hypothetical protein
MPIQFVDPIATTHVEHEETPEPSLDTTRDQHVDFITGAHTTNKRAQRQATHLHSLKDVMEITALIEQVLARDFAGRGRGIHSKLDSLTEPLPAWLDKRLRYLSAVRNKALVEPWWTIPDRARYLDECDHAAAVLLQIANDRAHPGGVLSRAVRWVRLNLSRAAVQRPGLAMATLLALSALLVLLAGGETAAQALRLHP